MKKFILIDKVKAATTWVLRQPVVQRLRHRYPRLTSFVANRFDTNYFVGLPLTLVILVGVLNLMLLSDLAESVIEAEWVVQVDKKFNALLYGIRSDGLSQLLYAVTWLGDRQAVFGLGGVATVYLFLRGKWLYILSFWLAMGGVGLSVRYGKTFISRPRPSQDMAYYVVDHFSFPSGHATTVVVLVGMLVYFLYRHQEKKWLRHLLLVVGAILIALVGFSRMYLGVHYLSDVLAGFLLGMLWLLVGISLVEVLDYRIKRNNGLLQR